MLKRKILVPLDKELMTPTLLEFIMKLASKNDFSLVFLSKDGNTGSIPFKIFDELEEALEVDYIIEKVPGNWVDDINEFSEKHVVDLVALCAENKPEKTKSLTGKIERPLLTLPFTWTPKEIKRIGFACDNQSFQDSSVLTILWHLAIELNAVVYIIHISDKPIDRWALKQNVEDSIEFYLHDVEHHYEFIQSDDITTSLLAFSNEKNLDLLATMPRNHKVNRLDGGGKVTSQLLEKTPIPIITID